MFETDTDRLNFILGLGGSMMDFIAAKSGGLTASIPCLIQDKAELEMVGGTGYEGASYEALVRTSDTAGAQHGDIIMRNDEQFTVIGTPHPDGTGMSRLVLKK